MLHIKKSESLAFEKAFYKAQQFVAVVQGYISHELQKCMEEPDKYILIIQWETLESHTEGFRKSDSYTSWKVLHPFYDPFPTVEHYRKVY